MKPVFTTTPCGDGKQVAITRTHNGTVKYLANVIAHQTVLMYPPLQGENLVKVLDDSWSGSVLFPEERWIDWPNSKLDTKKPMSMFPPGRHNVGYPAGLATLTHSMSVEDPPHQHSVPPGNHGVDNALYHPLRLVGA